MTKRQNKFYLSIYLYPPQKNGNMLSLEQRSQRKIIIPEWEMKFFCQQRRLEICIKWTRWRLAVWGCCTCRLGIGLSLRMMHLSKFHTYEALNEATLQLKTKVRDSYRKAIREWRAAKYWEIPFKISCPVFRSCREGNISEATHCILVTSSSKDKHWENCTDKSWQSRSCSSTSRRISEKFSYRFSYY